MFYYKVGRTSEYCEVSRDEWTICRNNEVYSKISFTHKNNHSTISLYTLTEYEITIYRG